MKLQPLASLTHPKHRRRGGRTNSDLYLGRTRPKSRQIILHPHRSQILQVTVQTPIFISVNQGMNVPAQVTRNSTHYLACSSTYFKYLKAGEE